MKLEPILHDGEYVFVNGKPGGEIPSAAVAMFRESEGMTLVMRAADAEREGYESLFSAAWIEISANTELSGLGITAAFSRVLADAGISCNVFAANNHDHIFVPFDAAERALDLLDDVEV